MTRAFVSKKRVWEAKALENPRVVLDRRKRARTRHRT